MMSSIVSLNGGPSYYIYEMSHEDMLFFDRFSSVDVYKMSREELEEYRSKALCRIQPYMESSQEPWFVKYHEVVKRIREMHCDELEQEISRLEKEKTNFQPLPRLERLKERLEETKLLLEYSLKRK